MPFKLPEGKPPRSDIEPETRSGNLTAALKASLEIEDSPLGQVDPDAAIELLLDNINQHFVQGTPEKVTDDELARLVNVYRAQALTWEQKEQIKAASPRKKKAAAPLNITLDLNLDLLK